MRILGSIGHPVWKITVFRMEHRLSLKLETGQYEITYKFRAGEGMESFEDVKAWIDEAFLEDVRRQFEAMHRAKLATFSRMPAENAGEFGEII